MNSYVYKFIKAAFVFICCFGLSTKCWTSERTYIPVDTFIRTTDGRLYAQIDGELVLVIELFFSDEDGYYILDELNQYWVCACCGYDLNIQRSECFNCKKPKDSCK